MASQPQRLSANMKKFMKAVAKMKQEDADKAIDNYCDNFGQIVADEINQVLSNDLIIAPGATFAITTSAGPGTGTTTAPISVTLKP